MTLRTYFTGILCCMSISIIPAQNLIANSGFEDKNICTELDMPCAPEAWKEVNYRQTFYFINKKGGKVGFRLSNDRNMRTYLSTELLCPLEAGETYEITFDLNLRGFAFLPFGIFLSTEDLSSRFNPDIIIPTHIFTQNASQGKIKPMDWNGFRDTFRVNNGGERFLYIGYFDAHPQEKRDWMTQIYLDNVELKPIHKKPLCPEAEAKKLELYAFNRRHWEYPDSVVAKDLEGGSKPYLADEKPAENPQTISQEEPELLIEAIPHPDTLLLSGVCFDFNKSTLNAHYAAVTDSLTNKIVARRPEKVFISGHTDNVGTDEFNLKLSLARAQTIAQIFIQKGIAPEKIHCEGKGESVPVRSNETESGRAVNRRIEVVFW